MPTWFSTPRYSDDDVILMVVRESSTGADDHLRTQAAGLLQKHIYRDGLSELLAAGLTPLDDPGRWNGRVVPLKNERASLVRVGNTFVLYALSTASKDTAGASNAFTDSLVTEMRRLKPRAVVLGPFSRVSRSGLYFSDLLRAFNDTKAILECNEDVIDFTRPDAESKFFRLCERSSEDRKGLVIRLEAGFRNAWYADKRFAFGGEKLPDGYVRDRERAIVLESPERVRVIQEILAMLAEDPRCTITKAARHLVGSGVFSVRRRRRRGDDKSREISLQTARGRVRALLDRIDNYEQGVWSLERQVVVPLNPDHTVEGFVWELPLPPGGWATPENFAALRERGRLRSEQNNRTSSASTDKHSALLPLSGYSWIAQNRQWAVRVSGGKYRLLARDMPESALRQGRGSREWIQAVNRRWDVRVSGAHHVLAIPPAVLHRSVAEGFGTLDRFTFAEADHLLSAGSSALGDLTDVYQRDLKAVLEKDLERAVAKARIASDLLYRPGIEQHMLDVYGKDYSAAQADVSRIEAELRALRPVTASTAGTHAWSAKSGPVLHALARLGAARGPLPRDVVAALQFLLRGFSIEVGPDGEVRWHANLAVPAAEGRETRLLGPITGTLELERRASAGDFEPADLLALLTSQERAPSLTDDEDRFLRGHLRKNGLTQAAIACLFAAPLSVRQVLADHLLSDGLTSPRTTDASSSFEGLVVAGYIGNQAGQRRWNEPALGRQSYLDFLGKRGPMTLTDLLAMTPDVNPRTVDHVLRRPEGTWLAITDARRTFVAASRDGGQRVIVRRRPCPHCGGEVDIVARTRECPAGLLCSACLRMPVDNSPVFPVDYRQLAKRPQSRRVATSERPEWWADLRQLIKERPNSTITTLARTLGQDRADVRLAADAMQLQVEGWGSAGDEWTNDRIRKEYLQNDRSIVDMADEMGISVGTLSKRLRQAGLLKQPSRQRQPS